MLYFIVYDTDDDNIRDEIRETLRDLGGTRVQYSAFIIELTHAQLQEVIMTIEKIIMGSRTDVRIIPICNADLEKMDVYYSGDYSLDDDEIEVL